MVTGVIPLMTATRRPPGIAILLAPPPDSGAAPLQATGYNAPAPTFDGSAEQAPSRPANATAHSSTQAPPVGSAGDQRSPRSPSGPPGRGVVAGSAAASGGGAAPAVWCAVLLVLLAYAAQELRRHRIRLVLSGPVGFVSPQQRPG
jgi:hypothetical protein